MVAKSSIVLDVKPWDDETGALGRCLLAEFLASLYVHLPAADMADVERAVRSIEADGLLWGQGECIVRSVVVSC